jgi:hypothetical protein
MGNVIILAILLVMVVLAVNSGRKHFKGSGGCCGGGGEERPHKKLEEPAVGQRVLSVEGMHCESCQARIEKAIDRLDGVVCKTSLHKKTATVIYSQPVSDDTLKEIVEKLGYRVTEIH